MKRAVWAATLTILATGAARADVVGFGTDSCPRVGWGGWSFYTPCPQLPPPDPIVTPPPPDNSGNPVSNPNIGTIPDPTLPGSGGSTDTSNTGGNPPNTGGGNPPNPFSTTNSPNGGDPPAVPEPSTMSLVLVSLAGLGLTRLRKADRR
jgi:hypothetical protein